MNFVLLNCVETVKRLWIHLKLDLQPFYILYYDVAISLWGQRMICGGLNETGPNRVTYWNVWFLVGRLFRKDWELLENGFTGGVGWGVGRGLGLDHVCSLKQPDFDVEVV